MKQSFNSQRDGILRKRKPTRAGSLSFQFPTGWNSTQTANPLCAIARNVSIPNGMEFYQNFAASRSRIERFQFPTGWNSTLRWSQRTRAYSVSIPNGMEFYLRKHTLESDISMVSIPNGMEFYALLPRSHQEQRHVSIPNGMEFYLNSEDRNLDFSVSIPNGMEFYVRFSEVYDGIRLFQFPTGWNSTLGFETYQGHTSCFNSQRDGILQWGYFCCFVCVMFQFPTGWNSTKTQSRFGYIVRVSIPNGMEFYA